MGDELPAAIEYVRTTATFDQDDHPGGLRRAHRVAAGVWARLDVHTGALVFVFEDEPDERIEVAAGSSIVIPPQRLHHVEVVGPVTFSIDFHRERDRPLPADGAESSGLAND
ncbi:MAG: DUF1971 domain-containing protein [Ilumatobacter sp.]|jgi:tellurite resistance-related uncharacterized protein|uniref:DUF1971 domain-containing protein n=1 Tax=Ilumatobacter sp. TaxID=1967498 RepID=UPI00391C54AF